VSKTSIRGTQIADGPNGVDLTVDVFGTLPVANGGFDKTYTDQAAAGRPSYSYVSPVSGLKNRNSNEFGIYNFKGSNTRILNQGLANCMMGKSGGGMTEHLWIGDSISSGSVSAVGVYVHDWLNAMALAFRDNLSNAGIPANGSGFVRFTDSNTGSDSRLSFTGSWANSNLSMLASNTVNSTLTFTADRAATVLDVWWYDATGATFTISVNGASSGAGFATVVCNGAAGWKSTHLTGLNILPGSKVLITETVHGTFGSFLSGLSTYTPNAGFIMHNVSQSGATAAGTGSSAWQDIATNTAPGQVFRYIGGTSRTVTDATSTSGSPNLGSATGAFTSADIGRPFDQTQAAGGPMFPYGSYVGAVTSGTVAVAHQLINGVSTPVNALQTLSGQTVRIGREPSCIHIALGVNDMIAASSMATLTAAITTIRNRYPNSDCILHLEPEMAYSFVAQATQQAYWQAMYDLADTLDVPLYDWRDRVGTYAQGQANGVYGDVNVHLTGATQASLGASLAQVIGFGSAQPQTVVTPVFPQDLTNRKWVEDNYGRSARIVPGATALTTAETIVAQVRIPANTFKVGSLIRYAMSYTPSVSSAHTVRIRIGTAGTVSDAAVVAMSPGVASASAKYAEGIDAVVAIGASGTHLGHGTETAGTAATAGTATATSGTFDSTKDLIVSLTVQSGTSNTTTMRSGEFEVKI
jgi:hypothetical protein